MAFLSVPNVRIAGIAAGVPKNIVSNLHPAENDMFSSEYTPEEFVATTGVEERRISETLTTSDLCFAAAKKLIADLDWNKEDIEALIFVSQTADYIQPATACILQNRLGLSRDCFALDVSLGCSGWVYGLSTISSLCSHGHIKKALLLAGDAKQRIKHTYDPLFGWAGSATAVEYLPNSPELKFYFGTDGSGYDVLMIPDGGSRNQITSKSFELEVFEGKKINRLQPRMKGMDVFSFGISTVPKAIKNIADHYGFDYLDYDYFVLHQANLKMNDFIAKKLKLKKEKVPTNMRFFGNTSSASIPLIFVTELKNKVKGLTTKHICCGFGIGLSWGVSALEMKDVVISDLVEVEDKEGLEQWA